VRFDDEDVDGAGIHAAVGEGAVGLDEPVRTYLPNFRVADPRVTAVIVGPRRPEHLEPALAALGLAPDRDRVTALFS